MIVGFVYIVAAFVFFFLYNRCILYPNNVDKKKFVIELFVYD